MKQLLLVLTLVFTLCITASAQRYAVVDSKYILDKMPDYKAAQKQLDQISAQ
jgi:outer membrane protein